jgi:hypothetical protein
MILKLCMGQTTKQQPWVPVIVLEHIAQWSASLSCAQFTTAVNDMWRCDWIRLSARGGDGTLMMRAMTRAADAEIASDIVALFCRSPSIVLA